MRVVLGLVLLSLVASCSSENGADCCNGLPAGGLYATFNVGSETFHASITHPEGIAQAMDLWTGHSEAGIPTGELECVAASWNQPWHWQMRPETVRFAEVTIELCDGLPSHVEADCAGFGGGAYCPWAAELVELRDCSTDPQCPDVPR